MKLWTKKASICEWPMQNGSGRKCYLTQKWGTHQTRVRIARDHFEDHIFAKASFRKDSFSVTWKTRTWLLILTYSHTCDTSLIFRELPEMSLKISSKTYHFLPKFWSLPHLNEGFSYIHVYSIYFQHPPRNEKKVSLIPLWNLSHVCTPDSQFLLVTRQQYFANSILRHYFSKATVLVDVLEQDNVQNISLITLKYTNMHQLFIFIKNILEMSNVMTMTSLF